MKRKASSGVTLLELLVAVSLLSLLSTGVLVALRVGLNAMAKANGKLMENRRVAGAQRMLENQIAGLMPVMAEYRSGDGPGWTRMMFFQGEEQSMRFVSAYSIREAWRGYPRILEFRVIPRPEGEGVRLVVNEHLYTGARSAGAFCLGVAPDPVLGEPAPRFLPIQVGPSSFVLADRLSYCRFSYFAPAPPPAGRRWVTRWTAPEWPLGIRIQMAPLASDVARIEPLTIVAPIRVDPIPGWRYAD
jgi:prepilin-type N-terminal cleavage/methylation domain-containing protein